MTKQFDTWQVIQIHLPRLQSVKCEIDLSPCEWICVVGSTSSCFILEYGIVTFTFYKTSLLAWNMKTAAQGEWTLRTLSLPCACGTSTIMLMDDSLADLASLTDRGNAPVLFCVTACCMSCKFSGLSFDETRLQPSSKLLVLTAQLYS